SNLPRLGLPDLIGLEDRADELARVRTLRRRQTHVPTFFCNQVLPSGEPWTRSVTPPTMPKRLFASASRLVITRPSSGPAIHQGSVESSVLRIGGPLLSLRGRGRGGAPPAAARRWRRRAGRWRRLVWRRSGSLSAARWRRR